VHDAMQRSRERCHRRAGKWGNWPAGPDPIGAVEPAMIRSDGNWIERAAPHTPTRRLETWFLPGAVAYYGYLSYDHSAVRCRAVIHCLFLLTAFLPRFSILDPRMRQPRSAPASRANCDWFGGCHHHPLNNAPLALFVDRGSRYVVVLGVHPNSTFAQKMLRAILEPRTDTPSKGPWKLCLEWRPAMVREV
jgi:hypothetical protein